MNLMRKGVKLEADKLFSEDLINKNEFDAIVLPGGLRAANAFKNSETLIQLLKNRMRISEQIGKFKKDKNHVILQSNRWEEALRNNVLKASSEGISEEFVTQLFKLIHQDSIRIQSDILSQNEID